MIIMSIVNSIINKIELPTKPSGEYYISNNDDIYAIIKATDKGWLIQTIGNSRFADQKNVQVIPYESKYGEFKGQIIRDQKVVADFKLYYYPLNDPSFAEYNVSKAALTIGSGNCDIQYQIPSIQATQCTLAYENGYWKIAGQDIFVNDTDTTKRTLYHGDSIFIQNLRIIVLNNFLIINNPYGKVKLNGNAITPREKVKVNLLADSKKDIDDNRNLYSEASYFNKSPRFLSIVEPVDFQLDAPPISQKSQEKNPAILTLGPQITMSLTTIMSLSTTVISIASGQMNPISSITSIVSIVVMLLSSYFWPTITKKYQKRQMRIMEAKRKKNYAIYLDKKKEELASIIENQKQILLDNNIPLDQCISIVSKRDRRLWERGAGDKDFLQVRLGIGSVPAEINIKIPDNAFNIDDEGSIKDEYQKLLKETRVIENVPLNVSFRQKYYTAIIGSDSIQLKRYIDTIMLQLMTFHSYTDLKIAVFTSERKKKNWEYFSILPHCWTDDKSFRMVATNPEEAKQVSSYLQNILKSRLVVKQDEVVSTVPHYIVFTDDLITFKQTDLYKTLNGINGQNGFSVLILNNKISNLPNRCSTFINIDGDNSAMFENVLLTNNQTQFKAETSKPLDIYAVAKMLANIPIEVEKSATALVKSFGFLEMLKVGRVEQINSLKRWQDNNPVASLAVPIGIDVNSNLVYMDIHEKFHGPHGLVAGTTGSGKSETIITYILSLAVNFHPYEMQFVLIDYKGGGLAGSFENKETGMKLPHLIGTITNLDKVEINRSMASIKSELRRRQSTFNKAREILNVSSMDIYKYQKYYREGALKEPMAHLLIISDEFAELKAQEPEFLDQLVSTARIGRSLGVHLILATQKPGGVVNDQIRSNSKFSICLKVADKGDSTDMIDRPDAAFLKQSGAFYLSVGNGEYFTLGQSAYAGRKYEPSDVIVTNVDKSLEVLDGLGQTKISLDNEVETAKDATEAHGEELLNVITYLSDLAKKENIQTTKLWLDRIPDFINTEDIKKKYGYKKENYHVNPVIGEYDDPTNQAQNIFTLDLHSTGNVAVFGSAGYGKENLIVSMIYSLITTYFTEEVNIYIIDYGAGLLKMFRNTPQVGDIITIDDGKEKIDKLFRMIDNIIAERKEKFIDFGGSYELFIKNSEEKCPLIVLVLNAFDVLTENYDYTEYMRILARDCAKYGVVLVFTSTASNGVPPRVKQNITNLISMYQIKDTEYGNVLDNNHKVVPSEIKGRGIFNANDWTYEFQTALPCEETQLAMYIKKLNDTLVQKIKTTAKKIPTLPQVVTVNHLLETNNDPNVIPIGFNKETLDIEYFNFAKHFNKTIVSDEEDGYYPFVKGLISLLNARTFNLTMIIDMTNDFNDIYISNIKYFGASQAADAFTQLEAITKDIVQKTKENQPIPMKLNVLVIGVSKFLSQTNSVSQDGWKYLFEEVEKTKQVNYMFVDCKDKIRDFTSSNEARDYLSDQDGLYIGNGFDSQSVINTKVDDRSLRDNGLKDTSDGVLVTNGVPVAVKIIQEWNGDQNGQ